MGVQRRSITELGVAAGAVAAMLAIQVPAAAVAPDEPDSCNLGQVLSSGVPVVGSYNSSADEDAFRFQLPGRTLVQVDLDVPVGVQGTQLSVWDPTGFHRSSDNGQDSDERVVMVAEAGTMCIQVDDYLWYGGPWQTSNYTVMATALQEVALDGQDDAANMATPLAASVPVTATLEPNDTDWYTFTLGTKSDVVLDMTVPTQRDYDLNLDGITSSRNGMGSNERIARTLEPGSYYIRVDNATRDRGDTGAFLATYTLSLSAAATVPPPPPAAQTAARAWRYKRAGRLEIDVDPNGHGEFTVHLQKLVKGVWVNHGPVSTTKKTHRKYNPKRGTYRVVVDAKPGFLGVVTNQVTLKR